MGHKIQGEGDDGAIRLTEKNIDLTQKDVVFGSVVNI